MPEISLHSSWLQHLNSEFQQPYMSQLKKHITEQKKAHTVYPPGSLIFSAMNTTPLDQVKVVILGQDPYHGPKQAHGLSFSVPENIKPPPSLQNIFKELKRDLGNLTFNSGNLMHWATQGVLLLNSVLTVNQGQAGSHQGKGWERFTDRVISVINDNRSHVVFMLWGAYAQKKGAEIDEQQHLVLNSTHPSPLSAHRGFLGCGHFSSCNRYLSEHNQTVIDWHIP